MKTQFKISFKCYWNLLCLQYVFKNKAVSAYIVRFVIFVSWLNCVEKCYITFDGSSAFIYFGSCNV